MTAGLRAWWALRPGPVVLVEQRTVNSGQCQRVRKPSADHCALFTAFLHAAPLGRTAAVVGHWGHVANGLDLDAGGSQGADSGLATRSGAGDANVHGAEAVVTGHAGGVGRSLLGREGRALTRPAETQGARALPGERIAHLVG